MDPFDIDDDLEIPVEKKPLGRPPKNPLRVAGAIPAPPDRIPAKRGPSPGAGAKSSAPTAPPPPRAPGGPVLF